MINSVGGDGWGEEWDKYSVNLPDKTQQEFHYQVPNLCFFVSLYQEFHYQVPNLCFFVSSYPR